MLTATAFQPSANRFFFRCFVWNGTVRWTLVSATATLTSEGVTPFEIHRRMPVNLKVIMLKCKYIEFKVIH